MPQIPIARDELIEVLSDFGERHNVTLHLRTSRTCDDCSNGFEDGFGGYIFGAEVLCEKCYAKVDEQLCEIERMLADENSAI